MRFVNEVNRTSLLESLPFRYVSRANFQAAGEQIESSAKVYGYGASSDGGQNSPNLLVAAVPLVDQEGEEDSPTNIWATVSSLLENSMFPPTL